MVDFGNYFSKIAAFAVTLVSEIKEWKDCYT